MTLDKVSPGASGPEQTKKQTRPAPAVVEPHVVAAVVNQGDARRQPFRFLDLPGEIRNAIYTYTLAESFLPGEPLPNPVGHVLHRRTFTRDNPLLPPATFTTTVPLQPGFRAPWTAWTCTGPSVYDDDRTTFTPRPALLSVSRAVAREAGALWRAKPLLLELHDVARWRDYKVSSRVALLRTWLARQDPRELADVRLLRVAVNYEVDHDRGTEPVIRMPAAGASGDGETAVIDAGWLRDKRALFDVERVADQVVVRGGCPLRHDSLAKLRTALEGLLAGRKAVDGRDLFAVAECLETLSCSEELRLRPKVEDCVTANGKDYYLEYREWKVLATIEVKGKAERRGLTREDRADSLIDGE